MINFADLAGGVGVCQIASPSLTGSVMLCDNCTEVCEQCIKRRQVPVKTYYKITI